MLPPGRTRWRIENQIGPHPHVVFPARAVEIAQAGHDAVVANRNVAMLYNPNTPYRRRLIDPRGDDCTFFVLRENVWRDIAADDRPFRRPRAPVRPALQLRYHRLLRAVARGELDDLAVEEALIALAVDLVADEAAAAASNAPTRRHRDAAHAMEALVSARFREALTLREIAAAVDLSPFHAARVFREVTGTSLHRYREQLRLRTALARLDEGVRLDELALELGFAHHSHFTHRFRRAFGLPPTAARRARL